MKRSTHELAIGILWLCLAVLMIVCVVINVHNSNTSGVVICSFAAIINVYDAIVRFKDYKLQRLWEKEMQADLEKIKKNIDILSD